MKKETKHLRRILIERRNEKIRVRFAWWTEVKRRRFDDVLKILSHDEFFVSEYTILKVLKKNTR